MSDQKQNHPVTFIGLHHTRVDLPNGDSIMYDSRMPDFGGRVIMATKNIAVVPTFMQVSSTTCNTTNKVFTQEIPLLWIDRINKDELLRVLKDKEEKGLCQYTDCPASYAENHSEGSLNLCAHHEQIVEQSLKRFKDFILNDMLEWLITPTPFSVSSPIPVLRTAKLWKEDEDPVLIRYRGDIDLLKKYIARTMANDIRGDWSDFAFDAICKVVAGHYSSYEVLSDDPRTLLLIEAQRSAQEDLRPIKESEIFFNLDDEVRKLKKLFE